jgi:hypothetical protein
MSTSGRENREDGWMRTPTATAKIDWPVLRRWRVAAHRLNRRGAAGELRAIVTGLCGLHARTQTSPELTLWARMRGVTGKTVPDALWKRRELVKTWATRGIPHLLPSGEYALWQAALSTYHPQLTGGGTVRNERLTETVGAVLMGTTLTGDGLVDEIAARLGRDEADRLRQDWEALLRPASVLGELCFGSDDGFTNPRTWLPQADEHHPARAVAELARRYLALNGPATKSDFGRWWGVGPAEAGRIFERMGDELAVVDVHGTNAWFPAELLAELRDAPPVRSVRLLPAFDPYVVAAESHARRLTTGDFIARIYRPWGRLSPVLLVNGVMAGTWTHEVTDKRVNVTIAPFRPVAKLVRVAAEKEAASLAAFFGGELDLTVTPPRP